mmetsp:Transcript_69153/g.84792  ORF Transcript_69153/g.84792 Transcript_69153/m.84792 type:complete len:210 (-) Transcript_69153:8-637(-)
MRSQHSATLDWDGVPKTSVWNFQTGTPREWVERAVRANLRASRAAREAEDELAEAEHHEEVARAVAQKAQGVMLQAQQDAIRNTLQSPSVQPLLRFCIHLAKALNDHPSRASEPETLEFRKYCQGFYEELRSSLEMPEVHGNLSEQKLYDSPPQEFPREPHWNSITPTFHPPVVNLDHRLAVQAACLAPPSPPPVSMPVLPLQRAASFL